MTLKEKLKLAHVLAALSNDEREEISLLVEDIDATTDATIAAMAGGAPPDEPTAPSGTVSAPVPETPERKKPGRKPKQKELAPAAPAPAPAPVPAPAPQASPMTTGVVDDDKDLADLLAKSTDLTSSQ